MKFARSALLAALILAPLAVTAADWPHWMGPHGDLTWRESGLAEQFPAGGPKVLWRTPVSNGYSGPSVVGDRVFLSDYLIESGVVDDKPGTRTVLTGKERVRAFDAATGKELWTHAYECPLNVSFPNGPRTTPASDGEFVWSLGAEGFLVCLKAADGSLVWKKELKKEYQRDESPFWGYAHHPVIHGDLLYCLPGGPGTTVVALNKRTGKEVWRALTSEDPGYAPPAIIRRGERDILLVWHPTALCGLEPTTGKELWSVPFNPQYNMSIMTPRVGGDHVFVGAIIKKSLLVKMSPDGSQAETEWIGTPKQGLSPKNGTPLVWEDHLYGCDADGELHFANLETGERLWSSKEPLGGKTPNSGTFFLVRLTEAKPGAPNHLLATEQGDLVLAHLSPDGYKEVSRANILEPTTPGMGRPVVWSHPAFARQCVFLRNDKELVCVSMAR
jgi:outer membrane protein assembly factor BamB